MSSKVTQTPNAFDSLIGELDTMMKAFPDKGGEGGDKKKCKHGVEGCDKDGDHDHGEMKKSFSLKLEDGTVVEVEDGSDLLKALSDRFDISEEKIAQTLTTAVAIIGNQGTMLKSLGEQLTAANATIVEQGTMIKSLQGEMGKIAASGAGRKAVLTVTDRQATPATAATAAAKNGIPEGITADAFFAKAFEKQGMGKLSGNDIALAETCLNSGMAIPENLVSRVLS